MRAHLPGFLLGAALVAVALPVAFFLASGSTLDACVEARTSMIASAEAGADAMSAFCEDLAAARLRVLAWSAGGAALMVAALVAFWMEKKSEPKTSGG